jgi:hypothetical protein
MKWRYQFSAENDYRVQLDVIIAIVAIIFAFRDSPTRFLPDFFTNRADTTRYLYVVCIYGAICLQILFLKHHILLFCREIFKKFS